MQRTDVGPIKEEQAKCYKLYFLRNGFINEKPHHAPNENICIMQQMMSEYFQTKRFHLEILEYFSRRVLVRKDI